MKVFDKIGVFKLMDIPMYLNNESMGTILAIKDVLNVKGARIEFDSDVEKSMFVSVNGKKLKFEQCAAGLYCMNTGSMVVNNSKNQLSHYSMLSTVKNNKDSFTRQEIKQADKARMIQHHIGWPRTDNFKKYVEGNQLINCPITVDDINRAEAIYGKPVPLLQGKMTRVTPSSPVKSKSLPLPSCVFEHHMEIHLYIDIFYVNGMPFFHTKSGKLNFLSVQYLSSRRLTEIINGLDIVIAKYEERGFKITDIHGDPEFDSDILRNSFPEKNFHIYTQGEHVGIFEISIRILWYTNTRHLPIRVRRGTQWGRRASDVPMTCLD